MITSKQIRAGRALLGWNQATLSAHSGVKVPTITSFEKDKRKIRDDNRNDLVHAMEHAGVEFLGAEGVRLRSSTVNTFSGPNAMENYFAHFARVYNEEKGGDVFVNHANERGYTEHLPKKFYAAYQEYMRQNKHPGLFHIIIKRGDDYMPASDYAEYRWTDEPQEIPFLVFRDYMSIVIFSADPIVFFIKNKAAAELYKSYFKASWIRAKVPDVKQKGA